MSRRRAALNSVISAYDGQSEIESFDYGVVIGVITNIDDERIPKHSYQFDDYVSEKSEFIGAVFVKTVSDPVSNADNTKPYYPRNRNNFILPIVGETVRIFKGGGIREYERIASNPNLNLGNFSKDAANNLLPNDEKPNKSKSRKYKEVSETGTTNTRTITDKSGDSEGAKIKDYGEYFQPERVNSLRLYEGDTLLQSRFGQSIRFSAYNNDGTGDTDINGNPIPTFSPTIIIRNRENDLTTQEKQGFIVEEDINRDGSIILLSSNDYKLDFQPGIVDDGGSSDFETTPINFELPEEYTGNDQILINSERIILSSKSQEMIFFSKGDYGFISDGQFTIDNGTGGALLDFGDDVLITTDRNDSNFTILAGSGNIFLNTTETTERVVRGDTLVALLGELIDAINQQVYNTPSGPTAVGPTNRSTFNDIKSRLEEALSTLNYTE